MKPKKEMSMKALFAGCKKWGWEMFSEPKENWHCEVSYQTPSGKWKKEVVMVRR